MSRDVSLVEVEELLNAASRLANRLEAERDAALAEADTRQAEAVSALLAQGEAARQVEAERDAALVEVERLTLAHKAVWGLAFEHTKTRLAAEVKRDAALAYSAQLGAEVTRMQSVAQGYKAERNAALAVIAEVADELSGGFVGSIPRLTPVISKLQTILAAAAPLEGKCPRCGAGGGRYAADVCSSCQADMDVQFRFAATEGSDSGACDVRERSPAAPLEGPTE
jgi:hypothetical protein